jgi:hypothetical protein
MNSMKRTSTPCVAPEAGEVDDLVVVDAPLDTALIFTGSNPAASAAARCRRAPHELVAARHALRTSVAVERVEADVHPVAGRPHQLVGASRSSVEPLVVIARSTAGTGRRIGTPACELHQHRQVRPHVGSPPVRRMPSNPKRSTQIGAPPARSPRR